MMPIATSVSARAAIGASAAMAVAPSNTFRRVMDIKSSSVDRPFIVETVSARGKASKNGKRCPLKSGLSPHGELLVFQVGHQHQPRRMRDRERHFRRRNDRLRRDA